MKLYIKAFIRLASELRVAIFFAGLIACGTLFGGLGFLCYLVGWLLGNTYLNKVAELKAEEAKKAREWGNKTLW